MFKNQAGQSIRVFAFNRSTAVPVTGDAANITCKVSLDGGTPTALADTNPTETEDGYYLFNLTQGETNGDTLDFYPESSTANVQVIPPNFNRQTRVAVSTGGASGGTSYRVESQSGASLPRAKRTVASTVDLVTAEQMRSQLSIGSDTTHDVQLALLAQVARDQIEHDTGLYVTRQTWQLKLPHFMELQFSQRPVAAISSITYYDSNNAGQTLATDSYELDTARDYLILHSPPATYDRFDAVTINFDVGDFTSTTEVDAIYKQACLLLVAHYFENPDMMIPGTQQTMRAYEMLMLKLQRASYP